jgi:hypothetical protein
MKNKNQVFNNSLIYGLIIGCLTVLYQAVIYIFGMMNNNALGNIVFFLLVIGILLSVRHYRDHVKGGLISFKEAFNVGFLTSTITGIIGAVFSYFQYKYLSPHTVNDLLAVAQESLLSKGIPEDQVELQSAILQKIISPTFLAIAYFLSMLFWGAILSLVTAAILKREENPLKSNDSESY